MCLQSGLYTVTTPFLFLNQTLSKKFIRFTTLGNLSQYDSGLPHFEAGVAVTADFPANWSQCQRSWRQPVLEGAVLEAPSLLRRLSLESRLRWGHHLFIFFVHSVFHGPHLRPLSSVSATQKVNPSSNSKLNFTAACVVLKKITWSYHRHLAHHRAKYSRNTHRWCSVVGKPGSARLEGTPAINLELKWLPKLSNIICRETCDKKQVTVRCD